MTAIRYVNFLWISVLAVTIAACVLDPFKTAETPAQRGYALEASYNIVLEDALEIASAPTTTAQVRDAIKAAEARSTPVIDSLSDALADYEIERAKFEAGQSNAERLTIVSGNLAGWVESAKQTLISFQAAFRN